MRAIVVSQWGGPGVLTETELERPEPGMGEILVRVHAAGVNPVDWKTRESGALIPWGPVPQVGWDVSGTVEAVGPGVTLYRAGDEVYGMPRFPQQAGAYAEYVTAPARHFARKPASLDHVGAAALPLAALTAWQALVDTAGVAAGQRVLVHAAAAWGRSPGRADRQGPGRVRDRHRERRQARTAARARRRRGDRLPHHRLRGRRFGRGRRDRRDRRGYARRSLKVLRPGGHLVTLPGPEGIPEDTEGVHAAWVLVEPDLGGLEEIAALVDGGLLKPVVDTVLPLEQAAKAHEIGELGRTTGKIVLTVA